MTVRTGLILLVAAAGLAMAWLARDVILLAFVGVLIAVVFSFPVGWLSRVMPRGAAVVVVLLVLAAGLAGLALYVAPQISEQMSDLSETAPRAIHDAQRWLRQRGEAPAKIADRAGEALGKAGEVAVPAALGVVSG